MKGNARKHPRYYVAWLTCVLLLVFFAYQGATHLEEAQRVQARGVMHEGFGSLERIEYGGKTYVEKVGLTPILLMGIDKSDGDVRYGARRGGQADFLLLLVSDEQAKTLWQLQIDRDTMAQVQTTGILGNPVGTREMQICLAHAFGVDARQNCNNTLKAVGGLLEGIEIPLYAEMNLDAVAAFNDALGGVSVTLQDDFSVLDPMMTKGVTLTLTGEQASLFVRARMAVGNGENASRMARQRAYLEAASASLRERVALDDGFVQTFLDQLEGELATNMSRGRMINEFSRAYKAQTVQMETLPGEHVVGSDGFIEFHPAQGAALDWVMRVFYEPEK